MNPELQQYIQKAREAGQNDEQIKNDLLASEREEKSYLVFTRRLGLIGLLFEPEKEIIKQQRKRKILLTLGVSFIAIPFFLLWMNFSLGSDPVAVFAILLIAAVLLPIGIIFLMRGLKIRPDNGRVN